MKLDQLIEMFVIDRRQLQNRAITEIATTTTTTSNNIELAKVETNRARQVDNSRTRQLVSCSGTSLRIKEEQACRLTRSESIN